MDIRPPINTKRPLGTMTDLRALFLLELEKPDLTQDQRIALLVKLADLEELKVNGWKRVSKMARAKKHGHKRGRPRKHAKPVEPIPVAESEDEAQRKFLETFSK